MTKIANSLHTMQTVFTSFVAHGTNQNEKKTDEEEINELALKFVFNS